MGASVACREAAIPEVFVLTTQTAHWFEERGFEKAPRSRLPKEKRELWDRRRGSKLFVRRLD